MKFRLLKSYLTLLGNKYCRMRCWLSDATFWNSQFSAFC